MSDFVIRSTVVQRYESVVEAGIAADRPLRKVVAGAVVINPYAGRFVEDLAPAIQFSTELGTLLGRMASEALGEPVQSYGKGGIAGVDCEQEHAVMFLTTAFGDAFRATIGGGKAWISSSTIVAPPGTPLTIPLAHKDALYVRANYDAVAIYAPDAPRPREVLIAVGIANRGRLNHRVGGLDSDDITGVDGLR